MYVDIEKKIHFYWFLHISTIVNRTVKLSSFGEEAVMFGFLLFHIWELEYMNPLWTVKFVFNTYTHKFMPKLVAELVVLLHELFKDAFEIRKGVQLPGWFAGSGKYGLVFIR